MSDFAPDDDLDALTSAELEEQAFGPDPSRKRRRPRRPRRKAKQKSPAVAPPAVAPVVEAPPEPPPAAVVAVTKFCYACGAEVEARAELCPHCGVRQPVVPFRTGRGRRDKSKGAATLLALTLGGLGAHRFYLGDRKVGLAMLLFCWTFVPALVGVVDFVRLAFMTDREFENRWGRASRPLLVPARPVRRLRRGPGDAPPDDDPA